MDFAELIEKSSLQEESSNVNNKEDEQEDKTKVECKFIENHQRIEIVNLKEEDKNKFLNYEAIIEDATCSKCRKHLVKSDKMELNKELAMVLSLKPAILDCNELLTYGLSVCCYYICHDCKSTMLLNTDNESKGQTNRRRCKIN